MHLFASKTHTHLLFSLSHTRALNHSPSFSCYPKSHPTVKWELIQAKHARDAPIGSRPPPHTTRAALEAKSNKLDSKPAKQQQQQGGGKKEVKKETVLELTPQASESWKL